MDWAAIKQEYMTSTLSLRALAKKHKTSYTRISHHSAAENWVEARRQFVAKAESRVMEKAAKKAADTRTKLYDTAEILLDKVREMAESGEKVSISELAGALKNIKAVLDTKSDADIEEQKARIEKLRKEAQTEEQTREVRVRIEGAGDGWES